MSELEPTPELPDNTPGRRGRVALRSGVLWRRLRRRHRYRLVMGPAPSDTKGREADDQGSRKRCKLAQLSAPTPHERDMLQSRRRREAGGCVEIQHQSSLAPTGGSRRKRPRATGGGPLRPLAVAENQKKPVVLTGQGSIGPGGRAPGARPDERRIRPHFENRCKTPYAKGAIAGAAEGRSRSARARGSRAPATTSFPISLLVR